jgi:hypothetical protein
MKVYILRTGYELDIRGVFETLAAAMDAHPAGWEKHDTDSSRWVADEPGVAVIEEWDVEAA